MKIQNLSKEAQRWLHTERLLKPDTIKRADIRLAREGGKEYIAVPNRIEKGKVVCWKCRNTDEKAPKKLKWRFHPTEMNTAIYGTDFWPGTVVDVYRCESEFDCLLMNQEGLPTITSTTGVSSGIEAALEHVPHNARFILAHDNDESGKKANKKVQEIVALKRPDIKLCRIEWPADFKKDVTDFALNCKKKKKVFKTELEKLVKACEVPLDKKTEGREAKDRPRIARFPMPAHPLTAEQWRMAIMTEFPDLMTAAELVMSVICQILINDVTNPCALILVDAPSAGKTIVINFFARSGINELIYHTDRFSPAAFVSNAANVKKEKLADIDLLPRIKHKLLSVCDMATIFSAREDDLNATFGILTRVLDGEGLSFDGGVHGQRSCVGDYLFMMLAGSTEIPRRVWQVMSKYGPRLFFFGLHTKEQTEDELVELLRGQACVEKEKVCRKATCDFLQTLWAKHPQGIVWNKGKDEERYLRIFGRCARFLARFRAITEMEEEWNGERMEMIYKTPQIEFPPRLNQLFYNVARGHAVYQGRDYLTDDDLHPVILLACDSAPGRFRVKLFHALIDNAGRMSTSKVEEALGCSKPTALHEMKILCLLGICDDWEPDDVTTEKGIRLKKDFEWFCSEECRRYLQLHTKSDSLNPDSG